MLRKASIQKSNFEKAIKSQSMWLNGLVKFSSLFMLVLLTSYQIPSHFPQPQQLPYSTIDLEYGILNAVYSLPVNDSAQGSVNDKLNYLVQGFFLNRDFSPVWTSDFETSPQLNTLLNLLDSSKYYGFPLDYFSAKELKELKLHFTESKLLEARVDLEVASTLSALKFMLFMREGIIEEVNFSSLETLSDKLSDAVDSDTFREVVLASQPSFVQFNRIIKSIPNFIDLHLSVKFTTPKFIDDRLLAKALYYVGAAETMELDTIDNNAKAIIMLQKQFNIPTDSFINQQTHDILVSLLQYRYYQACVNLNRFRRMQSNDENFLFVNIPEFKLHVIESKQEVESFNVIVGKKETPTPVFSSSIEKVITNPYWTVPKSIATDMLDKIRRDSTYLIKNGFFVINNREQEIDMSEIDWNSLDPLGNRYHLRQRSSSSNALGLVKIIFPNEHSVYIHDTPTRSLFSQKIRTFSYGCIRLENPDRLAQYLTDKFYKENVLNIKRLMSTDISDEISLNEQVKIHIQYITCVGNENADLEFFGDIYNLDKQEITAIFPNQLSISQI